MGQDVFQPGHSSIGVQPFLSVLNTLGTEGLQAYLDDILLFHISLEEHLERLVFQAHREGRIRLKPSKILLFQEEVEYFGHTLSWQGLAMQAGYVARIAEWLLPTSPTLLGFLGYYCALSLSLPNSPLRLLVRKRPNNCAPPCFDLEHRFN